MEDIKYEISYKIKFPVSENRSLIKGKERS